MVSAVPLPLEGADHTGGFAGLSDAHPLLLLPVRLETRFAGHDLKIRIYPDQIHLDSHQTVLTLHEEALGQQFWRDRRAAASDDERNAVVDALVAQLPARRAAWVAAETEPEVLPDGSLSFPSLETRGSAEPAVAAALPGRWAVVGWIGGVQRFVQFGAAVPSSLGFAPRLEDAVAYSPAAGALPVDAGFAWMVDYTEAVRVGMGITVSLSGDDYENVRQHGLTLLAVGVRQESPAQGAITAEQLLRAHRYTDGLELIPQGTPTNNTDEGISGWTARVDDVHGFFARELADASAVDIDSGAAQLARAFGLSSSDLLARVLHGDAAEEASSRAMNRVLWSATWGNYLRDLLAPVAGSSIVSGAARDELREWFVANVRGGAPLPALAAGAQPYGVLPIRRTPQSVQIAGTIDQLEWVLLDLRERWRESLPSVARLDPVLGDAVGVDPRDDAVEIFGSLPHPGRFVVRRLAYQRDVRLMLWEWFWQVISDPSAPLHPLASGYQEHANEIDGVDTQLTTLENLRDAVPSLFANAAERADATTLLDTMIAMVQAHRDRQDPIHRLFPGLVSGVFSTEVLNDPRIFWSGYGNVTEDRLFTRPLVEAAGAAAGETAWDYLTSLRYRLGFAPSAALAESGGRPGPGRTSPLTRRSRSMATVSAARREQVAASRASAEPDGGPGGDGRPQSTGAPALPDSFHADEPLLYQLLDAVVDDLSLVEAGPYSAALGVLSGTPTDELELRLRESLGLASHRLDAWLTGFARARLEAMRAEEEQPEGLQLGGYGWVEDLRPDAAGTRESQGFIHTPSLSHAATAAVLRAGWNTHGTAAADSTAAVDLRSDRVRQAAWILDGVRQGQALGDLLGCRFERHLHDRGLDAYIDDCRRRVLENEGATRDPRGPVDGLKLARLYRGDGITVGADGALIAPGETPEAAPLQALKATLEDILEVMDAVSDATLADSVHHLLQGNRARASASLDAVATGAVAPPELRSARTPARGVGIQHRLLLLTGDAGDSGGWGDGPRTQLAGAVESWAAELLGPPEQVFCTVTLTPVSEAVRVPPPITVTMADLAQAQSFSALDAIFESAAGSAGGDSAWRRRVEVEILRRGAEDAAHEGRLEIDFEAGGLSGGLPAEATTFGELEQLASVLRSLLTRARPLDARDLALPGEVVDPGWDLDAAEARVEARVADFQGAIRVLTDLLPKASEDDPRPIGTAPASAVRAAMMALAGYALPGAMPRSGWDESKQSRHELYGEAWALAEHGLGRLGVLADLTAGWASEDAAEPPMDAVRLRRLRERLEPVMGRDFPVQVDFQPVDPDKLSEAFGHSDALLGNDPAAAMGWLQQVAKVRSDAARLDEVLAASELIRDASPAPPKVAQLPRVAGEPWVARERPSDADQGRLALFALDHGGLDQLTTGGVVAGWLIDSWTERIPAPDHVTGVALNFDAPSSRPPQAMLLMVPPEGEAFSFDLVVDTLMETLEAAKLRAVDGDVLRGHGHQFPAIFPPGSISAGPQPEEDA